MKNGIRMFRPQYFVSIISPRRHFVPWMFLSRHISPPRYFVSRHFQFSKKEKKKKPISYKTLLVHYFFLLLSSICIRKYWIRETFENPAFDSFSCFEVSWTWLDHFWKCLSVCMSPKFCEHCIVDIVDTQKLMRGNWWKFIFSWTLK